MRSKLGLGLVLTAVAGAAHALAEPCQLNMSPGETQTSRGATAFGIYPLNRYARLQLSAGLLQFKQSYQQPELQQIANELSTW